MTAVISPMHYSGDADDGLDETDKVNFSEMIVLSKEAAGGARTRTSSSRRIWLSLMLFLGSVVLLLVGSVLSLALWDWGAPVAGDFRVSVKTRGHSVEARVKAVVGPEKTMTMHRVRMKQASCLVTLDGDKENTFARLRVGGGGGVTLLGRFGDRPSEEVLDVTVEEWDFSALRRGILNEPSVVKLDCDVDLALEVWGIANIAAKTTFKTKFNWADDEKEQEEKGGLEQEEKGDGLSRGLHEKGGLSRGLLGRLLGSNFDTAALDGDRLDVLWNIPLSMTSSSVKSLKLDIEGLRFAISFKALGAPLVQAAAATALVATTARLPRPSTLNDLPASYRYVVEVGEVHWDSTSSTSLTLPISVQCAQGSVESRNGTFERTPAEACGSAVGLGFPVVDLARSFLTESASGLGLRAEFDEATFAGALIGKDHKIDAAASSSSGSSSSSRRRRMDEVEEEEEQEEVEEAEEVERKLDVEPSGDFDAEFDAEESFEWVYLDLDDSVSLELSAKLGFPFKGYGWLYVDGEKELSASLLVDRKQANGAFTNYTAALALAETDNETIVALDFAARFLKEDPVQELSVDLALYVDNSDVEVSCSLLSDWSDSSDVEMAMSVNASSSSISSVAVGFSLNGDFSSSDQMSTTMSLDIKSNEDNILGTSFSLSVDSADSSAVAIGSTLGVGSGGTGGDSDDLVTLGFSLNGDFSSSDAMSTTMSFDVKSNEDNIFNTSFSLSVDSADSSAVAIGSTLGVGIGGQGGDYDDLVTLGLLVSGDFSSSEAMSTTMSFDVKSNQDNVFGTSFSLSVDSADSSAVAIGSTLGFGSGGQGGDDYDDLTLGLLVSGNFSSNEGMSTTLSFDIQSNEDNVLNTSLSLSLSVDSADSSAVAIGSTLGVSQDDDEVTLGLLVNGDFSSSDAMSTTMSLDIKTSNEDNVTGILLSFSVDSADSSAVAIESTLDVGTGGQNAGGDYEDNVVVGFSVNGDFTSSDAMSTTISLSATANEDNLFGSSLSLAVDSADSSAVAIGTTLDVGAGGNNVSVGFSVDGDFGSDFTNAAFALDVGVNEEESFEGDLFVSVDFLDPAAVGTQITLNIDGDEKFDVTLSGDLSDAKDAEMTVALLGRADSHLAEFQITNRWVYGSGLVATMGVDATVDDEQILEDFDVDVAMTMRGLGFLGLQGMGGSRDVDEDMTFTMNVTESDKEKTLFDIFALARERSNNVVVVATMEPAAAPTTQPVPAPTAGGVVTVTSKLYLAGVSSAEEFNADPAAAKAVGDALEEVLGTPVYDVRAITVPQQRRRRGKMMRRLEEGAETTTAIEYSTDIDQGSLEVFKAAVTEAVQDGSLGTSLEKFIAEVPSLQEAALDEDATLVAIEEETTATRQEALPPSSKKSGGGGSTPWIWALVLVCPFLLLTMALGAAKYLKRHIATLEKANDPPKASEML